LVESIEEGKHELKEPWPNSEFVPGPVRLDGVGQCEEKTSHRWQDIDRVPSDADNLVREKLLVVFVLWVVSLCDPNRIVYCLLAKHTLLLEALSHVDWHVRASKDAGYLLQNFAEE
jgi:hypothetical protein